MESRLISQSEANVIELFLGQLQESRTKVNIFLKSGVKLNGKILIFSLDERAVVIDGAGNNGTSQTLIFIDSIATIVAGEYTSNTT